MKMAPSSSWSVTTLLSFLLLVFTVGISSGADHVDSRLVEMSDDASHCWILGVLASAQMLTGSTLRPPTKRERFILTPVWKPQIVIVNMWWFPC